MGSPFPFAFHICRCTKFGFLDHHTHTVGQKASSPKLTSIWVKSNKMPIKKYFTLYTYIYLSPCVIVCHALRLKWIITQSEMEGKWSLSIIKSKVTLKPWMPECGGGICSWGRIPLRAENPKNPSKPLHLHHFQQINETKASGIFF